MGYIQRVPLESSNPWQAKGSGVEYGGVRHICAECMWPSIFLSHCHLGVIRRKGVVMTPLNSNSELGTGIQALVPHLRLKCTGWDLQTLRDLIALLHICDNLRDLVLHCTLPFDFT